MNDESKPGDERHSLGDIVSGTIIVYRVVANGSYTCGQKSMMYRVFKSLHCTPETNVNWMSPVLQINKEIKF